MGVPLTDYEKLLRVCEEFIDELRSSPPLLTPAALANKFEAAVRDVKPSDFSAEVAASWVEWFNTTYGKKFRCTPDLVQLVRRLSAKFYSEEDMRLVANYCVAQWKDDPKMVEFIRPSSILVAEKFGERLDQARMRLESYRPPPKTKVWAPPTVKDPVPREEITNVVATVVARLKKREG
jgi:uncharacterized phage protein (TIGR02220 family)